MSATRAMLTLYLEAQTATEADVLAGAEGKLVTADVIAPLLGEAVPNEVVQTAVDNYLDANPGLGDVTGPGSAINGRPALFDGTTGKLLKVGSALGNGAFRDVGTTADTLAAGDDERITGALQAEQNLVDLEDIPQARENLGLAIGVDVPAFDDGRIVGALQRPVSYEGQVATRCMVPHYFSAINKQTMQRSRHRAADHITSLKLAFAAWYVDVIANTNTGQELPIGAAMSVTASIEYPAGTFTQVLFSGSATGSIASGTTGFSDETFVNIPEGAFFWVRIFRTCTAGIVICQQGRDSSNGEALSYAPSGLTDQTMGGTVVQTDGSYIAPPLLIIGKTVKPSVLVVGDSRPFGVNDSFSDATGDVGQVVRSIGGTLGYLNAGIPGDRAVWFVASHAKRMALLPYFTHGICEYGINDIHGGSRSLANVKADLQAIWSYFGDVPVAQTTLTPYSTSTDGWTTTANQTPVSNTSVRTALNDWIRTDPAPLSNGHLEVADVCESSRNSGKWVPGYTPDGLHENNTACVAIRDSGAIVTTRLTHQADTLTPTYMSPLAKALLAALSQSAMQSVVGIREKLTANRTYYVRSDGSDSNDGLSNSAAGAWATKQKAVDHIWRNLDLGGFTVTVSVGAGADATGIVLASGRLTGSGTVLISGDVTTPSNCTITRADGVRIFAATLDAKFNVAGFKIDAATGTGLYVDEGGYIGIAGNMEFAACSIGLRARYLGRIVIGANYTISGGGAVHWDADHGAYIGGSARTITLTGTPAFSTGFLRCQSLAEANVPSFTYTGSATGQRYIVNQNAIVISGVTLPGSTAGATATGGQYA